MGTIRMLVVAGMAVAAWVGVAGFVISELATVKPSLDSIAKQQHPQQANPVYLVPLAQK